MAAGDLLTALFVASANDAAVALAEAVEEGRVKPGDYLLMASFGAGLTWGAGSSRNTVTASFEAVLAGLNRRWKEG